MNIEHDIIATKYGLPYDVVNCACCLKDQESQACRSGSCINFENTYGKIDRQQVRFWRDTRSSGFRAACEVYNLFTKKNDERINDAFLRADYIMTVFYPHYRLHVKDKIILFLHEEDYSNERQSKMEVIESCERILKEQNIFSHHYKIEINSGRNIKFSKRNTDLDVDFEMASSFLNKEFPTLFQYLIQKHDFAKFVIKRLEIERNRLRFIKISRKPIDLLQHLEDHYMMLKNND
ncbi:hypothetical protein HHI36_023126 [Cryptolaemus montrouzieri]|uniref:LAGLIDADG homing endonuclease n=1 Tax=Cryptolaemus montrouzieri TaxID=559131 RepID=A0ABD2PFX6_9CUCU